MAFSDEIRKYNGEVYKSNKSFQFINWKSRNMGTIKQHNEFQIIGESPIFTEVLELTRRIADSNVPVLIEGESGTGKELFAKALHYWSCRADEPFVAVNSAAIPEQLLERL